MGSVASVDLYISADVEADGPIPGRYSMLSFGLAVTATFDGTNFETFDPTERTFYAELQPISAEYLESALAISGLDRDRLQRDGEHPSSAMTRAASWVREVTGHYRPVLAAYPAAFDWTFLYWYFVMYADGGSPFEHASVLDIKTMYAIKAGVTLTDAVKPRMPKELLSDRPHTHHALDDAVEQADLFVNVFRWKGRDDSNE
jgi:hypothetical protein